MANDEDVKKVLVPPAGIHTPGDVAMPADAVSPLVEVPEDAEGNPDAVKAALQARAAGQFVSAPASVAHQQSSGPALTQEELQRVEQADAEQENALQQDNRADTE